MRTEGLKGALLSTLVIASLMVPAISLLSLSLSAASPGIKIYPSADVYAVDQGKDAHSTQLKFRIDDIPPGMVISSVKLWLYRYSSTGWAGNVTVYRVDDQTWGETITPDEFNAQALENEENYSNKFMSDGWDYLNVDNHFIVDYEAGHTYTSFRLVNISFHADGISNGSYLFLGDHVGGFVYFYSREYPGTTYDPYLEVTCAPTDPYGVYVKISPGYRAAFPDTTVKYTVTVLATSWERDNINLSVDNVWPATLADNRFENIGLEGGETTLTVTIPSGTAFGAEDEITVTATSEGNPAVSAEAKCKAISSMRIGPPVEDTYVTEDYPTSAYGGELGMQVGSGPWRNNRTYLKFDLSALPERLIPPDGKQIDDIRARLFARLASWDGAPGKNVQCLRVENDGWLEHEMTWGSQPAIGWPSLDTTKVTEAGLWYSWDVTDFVIQEYRYDNIASFCLKAETENLEYPNTFNYSFDTSNTTESWKHPYIIVGYDVSTWISPDYDGLPGGTLTYNVNVWNKGSESDNFDLTIDENVWETTLSPSRFEDVEPMGIRTVELTVKIHELETIGENDTILITAVSERSGENDNGVCIARASTHVSSWEDSSTRGRDEPPHHLENSLWGRATTIYVGRYYDCPERGWLKFDLRAFPAGTTVTRANLNLNCYSTYGANVRAYGVGDDSWSEYTINWLNKPSIATDNALDTRAVIENNKWYSWDVTDFVANEYAGDQVVSFCLVDIGENIAPNHDARFSSKEYDENWPYLEILATVPENEVRAYVDPIFQGGLVGDTLTYTITVMNKGTLDDNYDLTVENTETWSLTLDNSTLEVPAGENRTTTLNVTIPSGDFGTINDITITVTAQNPKKDKIRVKAHRSKATFGLENLYAVSLDIKALLRDDASKLVLKFYTYGNTPKGENVVWSTMPAHLIFVNALPDPQATDGMQKTELVLTDEVGATIQTLSTFTVWKVDLEDRFMWIPFYWSMATPAGKLDLETEFMWIPFYWSAAPPW